MTAGDTPPPPKRRRPARAKASAVEPKRVFMGIPSNFNELSDAEQDDIVEAITQALFDNLAPDADD